MCPVKDLEMRAVIDYLPMWARGHPRPLKEEYVKIEAEVGKKESPDL